MGKSLSGQDEYVIRHLNGLRGGYFLDIGAYDGVEFSNTYELATEYEWTGLLSECDETVLPRLQILRSESQIDTRAVWSTSGHQLEFRSIEGGKLSGIAQNISHKKALIRKYKTRMVETVSLNDLLRQHECPSHIQYMSMDIEGSEYEVLSTFDFSYTFDVVSIEHLTHRDDIYKIMMSHGYKIGLKMNEVPETIFVRNS